MNKTLAMAIAKGTFECCVRAQEKNRSLHNINLDAVVAYATADKTIDTTVSVKHWSCYGLDGTRLTHQLDLVDNRETSGQVDVWFGCSEGHVDDYLGITMEINTDPISGLDHVPSAHIEFDSDNRACSVFKRGERILLCLEEGVQIVREGEHLYLVKEEA